MHVFSSRTRSYQYSCPAGHRDWWMLWNMGKHLSLVMLQAVDTWLMSHMDAQFRVCRSFIYDQIFRLPEWQEKWNDGEFVSHPWQFIRFRDRHFLDDLPSWNESNMLNSNPGELYTWLYIIKLPITLGSPVGDLNRVFFMLDWFGFINTSVS